MTDKIQLGFSVKAVTYFRKGVRGIIRLPFLEPFFQEFYYSVDYELRPVANIFGKAMYYLRDFLLIGHRICAREGHNCIPACK